MKDRCVRVLTWLALLSKRLYRRPSFLAILLLIPLLTVGYGLAVGDQSGVTVVALAAEQVDDPIAVQAIERLQQSSRLIRFVTCPTPERAQEMVQAGKTDSAWIFPAQMEQRICSFVAGARRDGIVRVVEREETTTLRLAREKLSGLLYGLCSPQVYLQYIRANLPEYESQSDAQLMTYYDAAYVDENLFEFSGIDGQPVGQGRQTGYLFSPVRGILAVLIVLCSLATAMYYFGDLRAGTFSRLSVRRYPLVEWGCQMVSAVNVTAAVLLTLALCTLTVHPAREVLLALLYCLCTSAFAMLLRRICRGQRMLATLLPLLVVLMSVICPVFFDLGALRAAGLAFPPTYYINAAYNNTYLLYLVLYTVVLYVFCVVYDVIAVILSEHIRKN